MASGVVDMVEEEIRDGNGRVWFKRKPSSLSMRVCIRNYEKKRRNNNCKYMKIIYVHCGSRNEYRSDPRSYEHY